MRNNVDRRAPLFGFPGGETLPCSVVEINEIGNGDIGPGQVRDRTGGLHGPSQRAGVNHFGISGRELAGRCLCLADAM